MVIHVPKTTIACEVNEMHPPIEALYGLNGVRGCILVVHEFG
jgi:hypothetical protein